MKVKVENNARLVFPSKAPQFPLLSAPMIRDFLTAEVKPRLAQMGVSMADSDYTKMSKLCEGLARYWMQHPASKLPAQLYYRNGGDAAFAQDKHAPETMWAFVKNGGTRNGVTYTGLKGDFSGPVDDKKAPTECTQQHDVLLGFANALGIQARIMNIKGHVPFEYYDRQLGKWVVLDATFGIIGFRWNGALLSWSEIHQLVLAGRRAEIEIQYLPDYNTIGNPDLNFNLDNARALAVKWWVSHWAQAEAIGLPKGQAVRLIRSGDYTALRGSGWPESGTLADVDYSMFKISVRSAEPVSGGVKVRLAQAVPNFARYRRRDTPASAWVDVIGDTTILPSGGQVVGIDDLENQSNIVTVTLL